MKLFKSFFNRFLLCILIFSLSLITLHSADANAAPSPPSLNSDGVVLIDADSGNILYSKNGDKQFYPASTTKVLTALIVLEHSKLDDKITISKTPPSADGSSVGIKEGEVYTVNDLLLGLLLESGNDCAEALAEHVSGSSEEFAKLMNSRAKELGATNSNFKNPSGLPDEEHVTTAKDLALIMREASKNKDFVDISRTATYKLPPSNIDGFIRTVNNHNYILLPNSSYYYPYSLASKKGYTIAAKFTNVISAEKDGHRLIASFLKGEGINEVYSDVTKIFSYGFENFTRTKLYSEGEEIGSITIDENTTIPLLAGNDVYYTTAVGDKDKVKATLNYEEPKGLKNKAFNRGDILTNAKILVDGKEISSMDIVSGVTHEYSGKIARSQFFEKYKMAIGIFILFILLLLIYLRACCIKRKRRKKHQQKLNRIIQKKNAE